MSGNFQNLIEFLYLVLSSPPKLKTLSIVEKLILNFSSSALFHLKTRNGLKYLVNDRSHETVSFSLLAPNCFEFHFFFDNFNKSNVFDTVLA